MSKLKEILGSVDKKLWIYLGVILAIALIGIIVSVITYNINKFNTLKNNFNEYIILNKI